MACRYWLAHMREAVGCDPDPVAPETLEEWALFICRRAVRFIFYRANVSQTWPQFMLGCLRTTYELRDFRNAIGIMVGLVLIYWIRRSKPSRKRLIDQLAVSPEGMIPGSPLLDSGRIPKGQVTVAIKRDGTLHVVGGGLRIENHLVTPTHNTIMGCELWVLNGDKEARVDVDTEIQLAADVSAFSVPENVWSRLQVGQVKLGPLKALATVTVTSACDQKYSISSLKASQPMGRVVYEGSTMPGFSGSAYMNGTVALGMHCHGGVRGGGYELLYLWARLKLALDQVPEDSSDFFLREARRGYDYEDLGSEDVVLRFADGNYHRTKKDVLDRMKVLDVSNWADEMEYDELQEQLYRNPESKIATAGFSGEGQRPVKKVQEKSRPADSQSLPDSQSLGATLQLQRAGQPVLAVSKEQSLLKQLKDVQRKLDKLLAKPKKPMVHQTCPVVPNGQAS